MYKFCLLQLPDVRDAEDLRDHVQTPSKKIVVEPNDNSLVSTHVVVIYDNAWWPRLVQSMHEQSNKVKINFMVPKANNLFSLFCRFETATRRTWIEGNTVHHWNDTNHCELKLHVSHTGNTPRRSALVRSSISVQWSFIIIIRVQPSGRSLAPGLWLLPFPVSSFDWVLHVGTPILPTSHGIPHNSSTTRGAQDWGSFLAFVPYFLENSFFWGGSSRPSSVDYYNCLLRSA